MCIFQCPAAAVEIDMNTPKHMNIYIHIYMHVCVHVYIYMCILQCPAEAVGGKKLRRMGFQAESNNEKKATKQL